MDFSLTEEQQLIQDSFRGLLSRSCDLNVVRAAAERGDEGNSPFDATVWDALVELGMPCLLVAEEHGGAGLGMIETALVAQELGRAAAPIPFIGTAVMAPLAITDGDLLSAIAAGTTRIGVALQTSGTSRDVQSGGARLTGAPVAALDARDADHLIVEADGQLHLLSATGVGVQVTPTIQIDPLQMAARLHLDQTPSVPLQNVDLAWVRRAGRLALAAQSLGAAERVLEMAVAYALERKQFNRAIGSFKAVKHMCAEIAAAIQPCTAMLWYAAYAFDHLSAEEAELQSLLTKSHIDEVARFAVRTATEVHGGMGFADLPGVHFWYKRAGFNRAQLGSPEVLREQAAVLQGL